MCALVCGCVQIDFSIKIVVFLTLKFEVIIKMHLRYMSTKNLILTSKNPSFKRLKNLTLMSSNSLGINIKIIEILILIPKSQIGDRPCKYLSLVSDNCWIYWILMPIQIELISAWYDNNAPPPTANTRQVAAFGIAVAVLLSVVKFRPCHPSKLQMTQMRPPRSCSCM